MGRKQKPRKISSNYSKEKLRKGKMEERKMKICTKKTGQPRNVGPKDIRSKYSRKTIPGT